MPKILAVDDTPSNLIAMEAALAPLEVEVVSVATGEAALAQLLDDTFVVAVLDIQMPGLDGYELARLIRARERTRHLPIIFTTAYAHDEIGVLRGYQLGAIDFLFRPVLPEVLRAKVQVFITLDERNTQVATERARRERKEYEAAMLAEHDRRKDRFMAVLAHELRNPLAALRFGLDLLRERSAQPPSSKALDILDRQTAMLGRLVEDLLDISRIKADKIELRPEPLELAVVLDEAISMARPLIDDRGHLLTVDAPCESVVVMADNLRLGQVIANVINNAARYTPHGGRIDVMIDVVDEFGIVRVRDTGVGIPIEHQHRVFEMFAQERGHSESSSGLGLGLALARRLLELHHGTIAVASEGRDRGSTFELRVPRIGSPLALSPRKRTRELDPLQVAAAIEQTL